MHRRRQLLAITAAILTLGLAPSDSVRERFESESETCFTKLENALDEAGYSYELSLDWDASGPSIVDATEAMAAERGVQVAVLWDGARMHAVAPFLTHRRARALVRYAHGLDEDAIQRFCIFARAVQEDAAERAYHRTRLALIGGGCWLAAGGLLVVVARRPRRESADDQNAM